MRAPSGRKGGKGCCSVGMAGEVLLPQGGGEFFDGVAEGGAGHGEVAGVLRGGCGRFCSGGVGGLEPGFEGGAVAFPGFAEEPADGFVDEVVGVVQEDIGDGEGVLELAGADEGHGADDADALFPEGAAVAGEVVEEGAVFVEEPLPEQGVAAEVDEVPVVDAVGVGEVEVDAGALAVRGLAFVVEDFDEGEEGGEAEFVVVAPDAFFEVGEINFSPGRFDDFAGRGDLDSQELIAFAVLAGAGLEEAGEAGDQGGVGARHHLCQEYIHSAKIRRIPVWRPLTWIVVKKFISIHFIGFPKESLIFASSTFELSRQERILTSSIIPTKG